MNQKAAVFLLAKEAVSPSGRPLMLESVMFCPVLEWMGEVLTASGIQRIFVACESEWEAEVRACLAGKDVTVATEDREAAERRFLEENGEALRFERPALPFQGGIGEFESLKQLMDVGLYCRDEILKEHVTHGVSILDPGNTYVDPRASIAPGVIILPGSIIRGRSVIESGCEIGPNAMVNQCVVGENTVVNASQINESVVGKNVRIGPFAYLRPGCTVADGCKIGDFVELKNSVLGERTSVSHLTYIGDSDVGAGVNFGCGTITTNYDGEKKYRCTIGSGSFIGCNTNLIAPVKIGDGAYIAAGATVTDDVPAGALAIGRVRQEIREHWAEERRAKKHCKY